MDHDKGKEASGFLALDPEGCASLAPAAPAPSSQRSQNINPIYDEKRKNKIMQKINGVAVFFAAAVLAGARRWPKPRKFLIGMLPRLQERPPGRTRPTGR